MTADAQERSRLSGSISTSPFKLDADTVRLIYQEVCKTHASIADFRAKLLALLPLASGTGVFILLGKFNDPGNQELLAPIGLFGIAVTLGLFMYELRGIEDCTMLRSRAKNLEKQLGVSADKAQFGRWPAGKLGLVDEIGAGWVVYLAVLASWSYVAGTGFDKGSGGWPWYWMLGLAYLAVLLLALNPWARKIWMYRGQSVYLVELYVSAAQSQGLREVAEQARRATAQMRRDGTLVQYLRSIFVPEDETCFHVFEGPSAEAVGEASRRAAIDFERIVEAVE
jgi:Nickel responsive protein SCO4226-like